MKSVLAVATMAIVALVLEEKTRQIAGEAHDAVDGLVDQPRRSTELVSHKIENRPMIALLVAGGLGYAAAVFLPRRG